MLSTKAFECTSFGIQQDVPLQIWEAHTTLGVAGVPVLLTRALHNKLTYFFINYTQCYVHYYSPRWFIYNLGLPVTIVIVAILVFAFKKSSPKLKHLLIFLLAIYPVFMIFEFHKFFS